MHPNSKLVLLCKCIVGLLLIALALILVVYFFISQSKHEVIKIDGNNIKKHKEKSKKCIIDENTFGECVHRDMCNALLFAEESGSDQCGSSDVCCETSFVVKNRSTQLDNQADKYHGANFSIEFVDVQNDRKRFENDKSCGLSNPVDKVFEGDEAQPGEFPFFVLLKYRENSTKEFRFKCGGSLITGELIS